MKIAFSNKFEKQLNEITSLSIKKSISEAIKKIIEAQLL